MSSQTLVSKVERLEERVTALEQLPARIDGLTSQIVHLREEMRAEFRATREEARTGDESVCRTLREEIRTGDERILSQMRLLHEDVLARLTLIQEAGPRRGKRR